MKKIEAYVQPFMLQKVTDALRTENVDGMTVIDAKGFGKAKDESHPHHITDYVIDFTPKVKIEVICPDSDADKIIEIIQKTAHTGRRGDGKVFVSTLDCSINIRTGKKD